MWENLRKSKCDQTLKKINVTKLKMLQRKNSNCERTQNPNCDKTQTLQILPNSKTQNVTTQNVTTEKLSEKLNIKCDKTKKNHNVATQNSKCDKTKKLKVEKLYCIIPAVFQHVVVHLKLLC